MVSLQPSPAVNSSILTFLIPRHPYKHFNVFKSLGSFLSEKKKTFMENLPCPGIRQDTRLP